MATDASPSAKPPAPRLNVPAAMAGSLRLDATSPAAASRSASRLFDLPKTPSPSKVTYSDRFIPCRSSSRLQNFALLDRPSPNSKNSPAAPDTPYTRLLRAELFPDSSPNAANPTSPNTNLFRYKTDHSAPSSPFANNDKLDGAASSPSAAKKAPRKVPKTPHKVLDAPSLQDDFYLNLVDWSSQNMLAVGLGTCVYLWSASSSKVTKLCDLGPRDSVCAVHWTREGSYLAVGTSLGDVQIWDSSRCKRIRNMGGHQTRAGVLAWNSTILSSGSRDKNILQHDIRVPTDYISKFAGHRSEVCGLKWSHDDRELASGGNDNQLLVWNQRSQQPVLRLTKHTAAVKAIAWSPHQHSLVASGGGTADRCIKFWNTANGNMLNSIDTGSQVCNLAWCKNVNELVSTHGYSQNQIMVWKYPSMSKVATLTGHTLRVLYLATSPDGQVATLTGHTLRVLYLATSPDGQTIVTGAGDETLRFWNIFPSMKTQAPARDAGMYSFSRSHIR